MSFDKTWECDDQKLLVSVKHDPRVQIYRLHDISLSWNNGCRNAEIEEEFAKIHVFDIIH